MAISLVRTDSHDANFIELVRALDAELEMRYGPAQEFFDQFNKLDAIRHVVIAYESELPVACGAFRAYDGHAEIKRMFVVKDKRGNGFGLRVLGELEVWARELGYSSFVLETGVDQPEAIRLYTKAGYARIENYGQYAGVNLSVCMGKRMQE